MIQLSWSVCVTILQCVCAALSLLVILINLECKEFSKNSIFFH